MKKANELFMLMEFDLSSYQESYEKNFGLSTKFQTLYKIQKVSFWNYFEDSNCGFIMVELQEGYYVELYHKTQKNSSFLINKLIQILGHEEVEKIDPTGIFQMLSLNNDNCGYNNGYNKLLSYDHVKPFDLIHFSTKVKVTSLYFEKRKYSIKECERWANLSLKLWVLFNNKITNHSALNSLGSISFNIKRYGYGMNKNRINPDIDMIIVKILESIIQSLDLNGITFILEAMILYNEKKRKIQHEYKLLVEQAWSSAYKTNKNI